MFCLLIVLLKLSVLDRKTPLRKPNRGEGIVSRKPRPKSAHDFLGLLYCFTVLLCICVVSCPYVTYFPTVMARYSLFVLKVPLNLKQTNKQTSVAGVVLMQIRCRWRVWNPNWNKVSSSLVSAWSPAQERFQQQVGRLVLWYCCYITLYRKTAHSLSTFV